MFEIQQNHGLKLILDVFNRYHWKFQYDKRNEIKACLENIWEIDNKIKEIRKKNPDAVRVLHDIKPETTEEFLDASCDIMLKIVSLMKKEDHRLALLNRTFRRKHTLRQIGAGKEEIELEEIPELGYAKRLEKWSRDMKKATAEAYKITKEKGLKYIKKRLDEVIKDMRWFENSVQLEEQTVGKAEKPVQI
ncbi:hypothetical protein GF323_01325 [Candidatus Woesearchaeota archaeon]|nr:hypothetical protein [Candidatus Woesearchaeota archaeon]